MIFAVTSYFYAYKVKDSQNQILINIFRCNTI